VQFISDVTSYEIRASMSIASVGFIVYVTKTDLRCTCVCVCERDLCEKCSYSRDLVHVNIISLV